MARELSILDVGHGNCAVLVYDDFVVVVDAGQKSDLQEFLVEQGIKHIDVLLVSHADADHIGGIVGIITSEIATIDRIRVNSDATKTVKNGVKWRQLVTVLAQSHRAGDLNFTVGLSTGNTGEFDNGDIRFEIVAPAPDLAALSPGGRNSDGRYITSNTTSAVIRILNREVPVALLAGDLDELGFQHLLNDKQDIKAPAVIFPHHGGRPGPGDPINFTKAFCGATEPSSIIFSIGRGINNTPRPDIIDAIREVVPGARIICTELSTHCAQNLPNIPQDYLTNKFAKGKLKKECCGGTIVIDLNNPGATFQPLVEPHMDFIKIGAPTALCRKAKTKEADE